MRRNVIDADDAVGNGATFNGTGGNDRFVGRSADDTEADVGPGQVGEEFFGSGGRDVFDGRGGNDSFFVNGGDRIIAAEDDGFEAQVFGFDEGNNRINFKDFGAASIDDVIIEQGNFGTFVSVEGSQTYNLRGVDADDISAGDFIFSRNASGQEEAAAPEDVAEEQEEEVVEAAAEEQENEEIENDGNLVEVEGRSGRFGEKIFQGSAADELFVSEAGERTTINARGGNDRIVLEGSDDIDRSTDIINTGGGSDTVVLNENNTAIVRSSGFDVDNDVFDLSNLEGVNGFEDINFDVISNEESNNNGEFFFFEAGTASITVDEELQDALSEDNFIFADEDVAVG